MNTADAYRKALRAWASKYVPPGAVVTNVDLRWEEGYFYSSYTNEDAHMEAAITYRIDHPGGVDSLPWREIGSRDIPVDDMPTLGEMLTELFRLDGLA